MGEPGNIIGPFRLEFFAGKPFAGRAGKRGPGETVSDDGVGAKFADAAEDVVVESVDDGGDSDNGGDPDDDAEDGEGGSQGVFAEGVQS